jgi:hypothetical protein
MGPPIAGSASSPARILARVWLCHPDRHPEPQVHHQAHWWDEDTQSEHHVWNPCRGGRDDWEGRSLSPEGLGPKVFGSNMRDACFPKCF